MLFETIFTRFIVLTIFVYNSSCRTICTFFSIVVLISEKIAERALKDHAT